MVKTEARSPRTSGNVDEGIGKEVRWRFHRKHLASALDWLKCSHPFMFVFVQKFSRISPVRSSVFREGWLSHAARSQLCSRLVPSSSSRSSSRARRSSSRAPRSPPPCPRPLSAVLRGPVGRPMRGAGESKSDHTYLPFSDTFHYISIHPLLGF